MNLDLKTDIAFPYDHTEVRVSNLVVVGPPTLEAHPGAGK
jgi:hypothetical protein